jgi:hypothetical protein
MPVQYVKDFSFAPSPPRPTVQGYARGGHVKPSTPKTYAHGGSAQCHAKGGSIKVAAAKVKMGAKPSRNQDDAVSPGSSKRTPVSEKVPNKAAASAQFATQGRNTPVATKQAGDVERMAGYSDFKNGGRIKNLGHYAHGGKVRASAEKSSGKAGGSAVKSKVTKGAAPTVDKKLSVAPGSRVEIKSGVAKAAMGGHNRNAAIHAKSHKPKGPSLGALAGALSGAGVPQQGPQAPPGMSPGMGAPPGGQMGGMAPQAPTMGGGPPAMSHGGGVKHVIVHHVSHK